MSGGYLTAAAISEEALAQKFAHYDLNGDGTLCKEELQKMAVQEFELGGGECEATWL